MKNKAYIDLSHTIENGLITYKGLPAPIICDYLSREESRKHYEKGTEFQIGKIEMVSNTGTYVDVPFHRYPDGKDLSETTIDKMAGLEGVIVHVDENNKEIDEELFYDLDIEGKAVLIHTGWDKHWNTDQYFENHPYLTEKAAKYLASKQVALVGIDSVNIDDTSRKVRPVHTILLGQEILIVEHLCNLNELLSKDFLFHAVSPKIKGFGTFPVRAFAEILN
ncbi:cyclase family protein [Pseudalkalibacillus salsuginis]|uniref:cyclase family protein n=1 Tax=Pseudalkalibacillus salsuginis TaxID=2910972 RepID=UPI001F1BE262|nr:cyclase family protein [Pseudalkalibacillus salsuginis]MCF6410292.1 cyclase family protein [Pseudalkalibacillus salsuginis]